MRTLKIIEHISLDSINQRSADGDDFPLQRLDRTVPQGRR